MQHKSSGDHHCPHPYLHGSKEMRHGVESPNVHSSFIQRALAKQPLCAWPCPQVILSVIT